MTAGNDAPPPIAMVRDCVIDLERGGIVEDGTFCRATKSEMWTRAVWRWQHTAWGDYGKFSDLFPALIHPDGSRIMAFPVFSRLKNPALRVVVLDADGSVGKRTFCAGMTDNKRRVPSYPVEYGLHFGAERWDARGTDGCSDIFVKFSCGKRESRVIGTQLDEDLWFNDWAVGRGSR